MIHIQIQTYPPPLTYNPQVKCEIFIFNSPPKEKPCPTAVHPQFQHSHLFQNACTYINLLTVILLLLLLIYAFREVETVDK